MVEFLGGEGEEEGGGGHGAAGGGLVGVCRGVDGGHGGTVGLVCRV